MNRGITIIGDRVLVEEIKKTEEVTGSGIILPESNVRTFRQGTVRGLGTKLKEIINIGDLITFGQYAGAKLENVGPNMIVVKEDEIIGVLQPEG